VLQEQQNISDLFAAASLSETILQTQRIFIIDHSQTKNPAGKKILLNPNHGFKLSSGGVEVKEIGRPRLTRCLARKALCLSGV
jgi:hypothetical protein